jgi:uncharacterized integral membrane protein (TIGR00697 family)
VLSLSPAPLIATFNAWPPEAMLVVMPVLGFGGCLLLLRLFGAAGLYAFIAIAVIGANLQVTKLVSFSLFPEPIALGTVLFSSSYLATDMLAERFGAAAARRGVWIGFAAYLLWTLILIATLGYRPLDAATAAATDTQWALPVQDAMLTLFSPAPALFAAGMIAYLTSQMFDVWLFERLRAASAGRMLWLRNNASTMLSALLDNTVFSLLAWIVLAANPLPLQTVIVSYILGTWVLRIVVALVDTPAIYLARRMRLPE